MQLLTKSMQTIGRCFWLGLQEILWIIWLVPCKSLFYKAGTKPGATKRCEVELLVVCTSSSSSLFVMLLFCGWMPMPGRFPFTWLCALIAMPARSPISPKRLSSSWYLTSLIGIEELPFCHLLYWGIVMHHFLVTFFVTSWGLSNFRWQNSFGTSEHSSTCRRNGEKKLILHYAVRSSC